MDLTIFSVVYSILLTARTFPLLKVRPFVLHVARDEDDTHSNQGECDSDFVFY